MISDDEKFKYQEDLLCLWRYIEAELEAQGMKVPVYWWTIDRGKPPLEIQQEHILIVFRSGFEESLFVEASMPHLWLTVGRRDEWLKPRITKLLADLSKKIVAAGLKP